MSNNKKERKNRKEKEVARLLIAAAACKANYLLGNKAGGFILGGHIYTKRDESVRNMAN